MDERLRRLEQRWQETHAPEDEAALLRERVRAGRLRAGRLALAAHLGHPAARLAGDEPGARLPLGHKDLEAWIAGLQRWGNQPLIRAAIASGRALLPLWYRVEPHDHRPRQAIEAAEAFLLCPCPEHGERATEAASLALLARDTAGAAHAEAAGAAHAAHLTATAAVWEYRLFHHPRPSFRGYGHEIEGTIRESASEAAGRAAELRSVRLVANEVRAALVPWVLDRGDPVAEARPTWLPVDDD